MNLEKKIEEIRSKPEHIRKRYVIGSVAVSMFFIVIIWIFSLQQSFSGLKSDMDSSGSNDIGSELQKVFQQAPSFESLQQNSNFSEGIGSSDLPQDSQQTSETDDSTQKDQASDSTEDGVSGTASGLEGEATDTTQTNDSEGGFPVEN